MTLMNTGDKAAEVTFRIRGRDIATAQEVSGIDTDLPGGSVTAEGGHVALTLPPHATRHLRIALN